MCGTLASSLRVVNVDVPLGRGAIMLASLGDEGGFDKETLLGGGAIGSGEVGEGKGGSGGDSFLGIVFGVSRLYL